MPDRKTYDDFDFFDSLYGKTKENTVIMMETDGTITAVNSAFTECFGYEENDIVGKNTAILFTEEDRKKGFPKRELDEVQKKGQSNDNNYLVNKDNRITWVSGESILVENKEGEKIILKIIQDIHQQKTSENSIRELNRFNENILESIQDVVLVLDEKMNIIKANDSYKILSSKDENEPRNVTDFLKNSESEERVLHNLQEAIRSKSAFTKEEAEIETADGNKRIFEVTATLLENSDKENLLLVMHDITIYKELEREREDIIGFITHELRNPLSNLMLSNDLMKDAAEKNEVSFLKEMLIRSEKNVQRMNKMITGLYEATKVHSGYFPLDLSEFNFENMLKEAIDTIQALNPDYNILKEGDGNFKVVADRFRLIQVITNFLSNAIKYSNGNKEVKLNISHNNDLVSVHVKDNGTGIPKEHLPFVFERFFRVEKTRKIEGIGLGLYLCRQIIRSHNGKVGVQSEENKGSDFYFTIPLNTVANT
ncbi:MAG TPA: PAS domain-containing sensor histidine kinase [Hanamia sp.]|nr:PAS domain-containing sensor histidine kinase [Hanamia sp.]